MLTLLAAALVMAPAKAVRILFVGNSYTYINEVPKIVASMAAPKIAVEQGMVAAGGATFSDHLASEQFAGTLAKGWDYVVCQEQSTFGRPLFVNGEPRVNDSTQFQRDAKELARRIRVTGAQPILLEFWPRRDASERDWQFIRRAHLIAAKESGMRLIEGGVVWQYARRELGNKLYDSDGSHASAIGSYVFAATLATKLLGVDPAQLPERVQGPTRLSVLAKITAQERAAIVRALRQPMPPVPAQVGPIAYPTLKKGSRLTMKSLTGTWSGTTTLLPRLLPFPAKVKLVLRESKLGSLTISFGGQPQDMVGPLTKVKVEKDRFTFAVENGPERSLMTFAAVRRKGKLEGVARMILPDKRLLGIGTFALTRS